MDTSAETQTWHYGVVARWWAEFNTEGPEIAYFQTFVEAGQPALDVACGTGRLLIPYLQAGLDVDGCDISPDMLALCRERAEREGLSPNLYQQAMHELDLPRRYRTIYVCGGFGLGGNRDHDEVALRRIYEHLEPGGALVLDNEVPYDDAGRSGRYWTTRIDVESCRSHGPNRASGERVRTAPSTSSARRARRGRPARTAGDEGDARVHVARGRLVEQDEHVLKMTFYFTNELRLMLERAGFVDIQMRGDLTDDEPTSDTESIVYIARKASRG